MQEYSYAELKVSSLTELVESSQENISGDVLMGVKGFAQARDAVANWPTDESDSRDKMWNFNTHAKTHRENTPQKHTHKDMTEYIRITKHTLTLTYTHTYTY